MASGRDGDREERVVGFVTETLRLFEEAGLRVPIVSGGGTGTQSQIAAMGCTEARCGGYVWEGLDRLCYSEPNLGVAALSPYRCPLRLWTTVVSTTVPGQVVVDAGSKAFAPYPPGLLPREWAGACVEHPGAIMKQLSVEHGIVDVSACAAELAVGDVQALCV